MITQWTVLPKCSTWSVFPYSIHVAFLISVLNLLPDQNWDYCKYREKYIFTWDYSVHFKCHFNSNQYLNIALSTYNFQQQSFLKWCHILGHITALFYGFCQPANFSIGTDILQREQHAWFPCPLNAQSMCRWQPPGLQGWGYPPLALLDSIHHYF